MAYVDPDFTDLDLSVGWTESGSPTYEDGPNGGTANAFVGNDTTLAKLTRSTALIPAGTTNFTIGVWLKMDATEIFEIPIAQFDTGPDDHDFQIASWTGGGYSITCSDDNVLNKTTTTTSTDYSGLGYKFMMFSCAVGDLDVFGDGVEASYSVQDSDGGSGFSAIQATPIVTTIGEWLTPAGNRSWSGSVGDLYLWYGTDSSKTLTAAQAAEFFSDLMGNGESSALVSPLVSPLVEPMIGGLLS